MKFCRTRASALKLGRPYYKTGKVCVNNHVSHRFTKTGRCVECDYTIHKIKRVEAIRQRTPAWCNIEAIKAIYKRSNELGVDYQVDHIIPLLGDNVSGLHVPENLQIILKKDNLSKGNRYVI